MTSADRPGRREALVRLGSALCIPLAGSVTPSIGASSGPAREGIASAHPLATEAGLRVLGEGGNAVDAAVAVAAALAVVEPFASGIGGGGFFLLRRAGDARDLVVDARETAPQRAHARMYLDGDGHPLPRASLDGALAAAIPGLPAALAHLARVHGTLPLSQSLAPAIRLAADGFPVDTRLAAIITLSERRLASRRSSFRRGVRPRPGNACASRRWPRRSPVSQATRPEASTAAPWRPNSCARFGRRVACGARPISRPTR
jgi:gamma-glutamyltranspeptidase/glutathione hydrolase